MPAISARPVQRSRKPQYCVSCLDYLPGEHVSAYGYAERGDEPFTIRMCWVCATGSSDDVILRATRRPTKEGEE